MATASGEALERRVGDPEEHAQLGGQLIWLALPLVALLVALLVLDRRPGSHRTLATVVAAAAVLAAFSAAVSAGVLVYRVGDSGARAVWGDTTAAAR